MKKVSGAGSRVVDSLGPNTENLTPSSRIGVISDTHSLVRPEALAALRGVEHIVHAGDIGSAQVLNALREIAPVTAVRGNNDHGAWVRGIEATAAFDHRE